MKARTIIALCLAGLALMLLLPMVIAFVAGYIHGHTGREPDLNAVIPAVLSPMIVGLMVAVLISVLVWMRSIDEAAREAHKFAWFWGGLTALAVGGVFVVLAAMPQAASFDAQAVFGVRDDPAAYMALGAAVLTGAMGLGYLVAWAWWWLSRMRG